MILYHGTSASNGRIIEREGIRPPAARSCVGNFHDLEDGTPPRLRGHAGAVYLSHYWGPHYAFIAADLARPCDDYCLIEVETARLDCSRLVPDEEFLAMLFRQNLIAQGQPEPPEYELHRFCVEMLEKAQLLWIVSLQQWSACAYLDAVPREAITRIEYATRAELEKSKQVALSHVLPWVELEKAGNNRPITIGPLWAVYRAITRCLSLAPGASNPARFAIEYPLLWERAFNHFALHDNSIHGPNHWTTVEDTGISLAQENGADMDVVRLFAVLHDACRSHDGDDPDHGRRAAALAACWRNLFPSLEEARFETLQKALIYHADGQTSDDLTIGTCWDADRLDLMRVGIEPDARFLSTEAGRRAIEKTGAAHRFSMSLQAEIDKMVDHPMQ
jgi:uncharacterized protein